MSAVKYDELGSWIELEEDKTHTENDIEEFLQRKVCPACKQTLHVDEFEDGSDVTDVCNKCKTFEE